MILFIFQKLKAKNQLHILLVLALSSIFSIALISFRVYYSGLNLFIFLTWNLFLAWIPYGISLIFLVWEERLKSIFLIGFLLGFWLLFFPNAPYILTDLFHLSQKKFIPLWYDLILILSFAWNGLLLGFLSLANIQNYLSKKMNVFAGWFFAFISLGLSAFGIYMGRFLRWNSWNILSHPQAIFYDILDRIIHPFAHKQSLAMTLVFSVFLILTYLTFKVWQQEQVQKATS